PPLFPTPPLSRPLLYGLSHAPVQFRGIPAMKGALSDHAQVSPPRRGEVVSRLCGLGRAHVTTAIAQALEHPPIAGVARPHGAGVVAAMFHDGPFQEKAGPQSPTARLISGQVSSG